MLNLPAGYTLETTKRRVAQARADMFGSDWQIVIYHQGYPAFTLTKELRSDRFEPTYAGKLSGRESKWHTFDNLGEAVKVMCTKHRIGVGHG
jgi:hypothetical protein